MIKEIRHTNSSLRTIKDLLFDFGLSPFSYYENRPRKFLDLSLNGKTNFNRITENYKSRKEIDEAIKLYKSLKYNDIKVPTNTMLLYETEHIRTDLLSAYGKGTWEIDRNELDAKEVIKTNYLEGISRLEFRELSVWCFSNVTQKLEDLSPYITSIQTSHNKQDGGSFSISVSNVGVFQYHNFGSGGNIKEQFIMQNELPGLSVQFDVDKNGKISDSYFERIIGPQSLFFISFRKNELDCSIDNLRDVHWDMIGFCKVVNKTEYSTNISGYDLNSLLIDDGCYFYPVQMKGTKISMGAQSYALTERVMGKLYTYYSYGLKSISVLMRFLFNQLTNIELVDPKIFSAWQANQDVATYYIKEKIQSKTKNKKKGNKGKQKEEFATKEIPMKGIWQIVRFAIDNDLSDYRLLNTSMATDRGTIRSFIDTICQEPLVEFYGDTFKNKFWFFARKPPFDKKGYLEGVKYAKEIDLGMVSSYSFSFSSVAYSIYKINPLFLPNSGAGVVNQIIFPAVILDVYGKKYGAKVMEINSNYFPYMYLHDSASVGKSLYGYIDRFFEDFKFLIESNAYLPFSRSGFIELVFSPEIKSNTFIYFKPTNEYFYVDSVEHSYDADTSRASTRLVVSRGLVKNFVHGQVVNGVKPVFKDERNSEDVSYFNIVSTNYKKELDKSKKNGKENYTSAVKYFTENKQLFYFFENKCQFNPEYKQ